MIEYSKNLEIKYDVDVFVAGGGPAGIAAVVSCARQRKDVFIAESFSAFGGAASTMLVPVFMTFGNGDEFQAEGIGREVYNNVAQRALPRFRPFCPMSIPIETLKVIYDDMIIESGAKYQFHTSVVDVIKKDNKIDYVICSAKGSMFAVKAKIYIDCTGDGDLSYYAGAEYEFGDENGKTMATTLCGMWTGIDWSRVQKPDNRRIEEAFDDNVFANKDKHLPGMYRIMKESTDENGKTFPDGVGGSNAGHIYDIDATDAKSLTSGLIAGRKQLPEYREYYKKYLSGYENAELIHTAPYLGIRESRRIVCDYKLVLDDFKSCAIFDDEIGRYSYNIDIHSSTNDKEGYEEYANTISSYKLKNGESYGIPYRAIAVKDIENLLCAGRCISTDRYMQSSVRVMPGCFITGQAAGIAAAVACDSTNDVHNIDVREVQKRLKSIGAFLPNYSE